MDNDLLHAPFTKPYWRKRRVLILGLGQYPQGSGVSAALLFARLGADVIATDLKMESELGTNVKRLRKYSNVRFHLGAHDLRDIDWAEIIVANPRVRPNSKEMKRARQKGIPTVSDISLFLDRCKAPVVTVTGTRGKSTTATLIAWLLRAGGRTVWLGGNLLVSPLNFLHKIQPTDIVVLELSSWQCESLSKSKQQPCLSVITNMMRDHLNTYDGMEEYAEAKAQVFRHQTEEDIVLLNADDSFGARWIHQAPSNVLTFGKRASNDGTIRDGWLIVHGSKVFPVSKLPVFGTHNYWNALVAVLAARVFGVHFSCIKRALATFVPLPNRLEPIRTVRGVLYVNDTCATTPDGTVAALESFLHTYEKLWFILGGADKDLEYEALGKRFGKARNNVSVFLLPGTASEKIAKQLIVEHIPFERVSDMETAVLRAASIAQRGDVVVLSPGAASFGLFANEFERGAKYSNAVRMLKGTNNTGSKKLSSK